MAGALASQNPAPPLEVIATAEDARGRRGAPGPMPGAPKADAWTLGLVMGLLVLASFAFRVPALLNARSTNSDASIVGLQAMHIARGELSPFLWGSGYQTSADAFVAAAFFRVAGPSPLALMISALALHIVATLLVFATLRRRFTPWTALVLTLPLIVSPASIHTYALYPPRQLSITLAVAAMWALNGARHGRVPHAMLAFGTALYGLAVSADPYPIVLAPVVLGYAALVAQGGDEGKGDEGGQGAQSGHGGRVGRRASAALGFAVGVTPFVLLHRQAGGASPGQLRLAIDALHHNWELLVRDCLPWALSYKVYYAPNAANYRPWDPPIPIQAVQLTGAVTVGAIVLFGLASARWSRIPASLRQLGFAGAMTYPVAIGAFLVSVMVMDHFSMRYLAVLTLMLPFAAAPTAYVLGRGRFAALLTPHLVASAICGWLGYGPFVRGPLPVVDPTLRDDYALLDLLRARHITHAEADYWASYRLTLLFAEEVVVVPTNSAEDRYAPYRRAFEAAPRFAYVFDPSRSREDVGDAERRLRASNADVEKVNAGGHTVFIVARR